MCDWGPQRLVPNVLPRWRVRRTQLVQLHFLPMEIMWHPGHLMVHCAYGISRQIQTSENLGAYPEVYHQ